MVPALGQGRESGDKRKPSTAWRSLRKNPQSRWGFTQHFLPGLFDARRELLNQVVDTPVLLDQLRDLRRRVDDGGVVAAPELLSDLGQGAVRELAAEVHRHLPRIDDRL